MSRISPDEVILGLLAAERSAHGYQLLEHFRDPSRLGQVWQLGTSQLYAILKRLEHNSEIDGCEVFASDAPPRTEYWLTPTGEVRFGQWLNNPTPSASTRRIRTEFLSRLYLAKLIGHPIPPLVQAQKAACFHHRQQLAADRDQAGHGVGYLALSLLIAEMDAILEWLDQCEIDLFGRAQSL